MVAPGRQLESKKQTEEYKIILKNMKTREFTLARAAAFFAAAASAGIAGLAVGIPSLRLRGDYLAIVTLGFGEIIRVLILNIDAIGGSRGFSGVGAGSLAGGGGLTATAGGGDSSATGGAVTEAGGASASSAMPTCGARELAISSHTQSPIPTKQDVAVRTGPRGRRAEAGIVRRTLVGLGCIVAVGKPLIRSW
jgi:hypothetical protein